MSSKPTKQGDDRLRDQGDRGADAPVSQPDPAEAPKSDSQPTEGAAGPFDATEATDEAPIHPSMRRRRSLAERRSPDKQRLPKFDLTPPDSETPPEKPSRDEADYTRDDTPFEQDVRETTGGTLIGTAQGPAQTPPNWPADDN